jgi:hypothetical protein
VLNLTAEFQSRSQTSDLLPLLLVNFGIVVTIAVVAQRLVGPNGVDMQGVARWSQAIGAISAGDYATGTRRRKSPR